MAETVTLPAIGTVKKQYVYIGGAVVVGIVGYAYWRRRGEPEIIDESVAGGDIGNDDGWGNTPGRTGGSGGDFVPADPSAIPTRTSWTAEVVEKLSAAGYNEQTIYNTLGKWFGGQGLTAAEKLLIMAARAAAGDPPPPVPPMLTALPTPTTPAPTPTPTPTPTPSKPPAASYATVTVVKWVSGNVAWNSTLWGIAKKYGYGSASNNYVPIWNDAKNAKLKALRGSPSNIRAGDTVYVKLK